MGNVKHMLSNDAYDNESNKEKVENVNTETKKDAKQDNNKGMMLKLINSIFITIKKIPLNIEFAIKVHYIRTHL